MKNTKWQNKILELHANSNYRKLTEIYNYYSTRKQIAFDSIYQEYCDEFTRGKATMFRILTFNKTMFTCGYYYYKEDEIYFKYFSHRRIVMFRVYL